MARHLDGDGINELKLDLDDEVNRHDSSHNM